MMKRLLLYISMILPLLYSCNEEAIVNPALQEGDTCELRFTVTIPQPTVVSSRAITDENPTISSLTLILFDENGLYKGKKGADPVTSKPIKQNDGTYKGTYTVILGRTEEKRIIHFVANCTVGDFETNTHENVVLPTLVVDRPQDAYWQRMTITGIGLDKNNDNITDNLPEVRLIRNFVAIKVTESGELITGNENSAPFIQGYALYNEANKGTVVPYFREEGGFPSYSTGITYTDLNGTQKYMGIEPAGVSYDSTNPLEADFTKVEKYTYERSYSDQTNAQNPTFIVLKGLYNNVTYYYRVDIAKDFKFYQLLRNFRYIININTICAGYTTIDQAIKGSSFNNLIDVGIKVEEITDGVTSLYVSPTDITVVNGTQSVEIGYKCETELEGVTMSISDLFDPEVTHPVISSTSPAANTTGITDLEGIVTVNLIEYFKKDASNNYEVDATTGRYISTMSGNKQIQSFEIRTSNGLYRRVRINLVDKIEFNPVFVGPDSEGKYIYQYTLPDELPESMFPLEIYFYEPTNSFTPVVGQGLSVDLIDATTTSTGTWRYKKTLSYEEYLADGDKIFSYKFVANETLSTSTAYTMEVSNVYAYTDDATLTTIPETAVSDLALTNAYYGIGREVTLTFETESTDPITFSINNLQYDSDENVIINGTFIYTPTTIGEQEITFTTANTTAKGEVAVIKDGMVITSVTNERMGWFSDLTISDAEFGEGKNVTITFTALEELPIGLELIGLSSTTDYSNYTPTEGENKITVSTSTFASAGTVNIVYPNTNVVMNSATNNRTVNSTMSVTFNNVNNYRRPDDGQIVGIYVEDKQIGTCEFNVTGGNYTLTNFVFTDTTPLTNSSVVVVFKYTKSNRNYINTGEQQFGNIINGAGITFEQE